MNKAIEDDCCIYCGRRIPIERRRVLPDVETCVKCAVEYPTQRKILPDEIYEDLDFDLDNAEADS